MNKIIVKLTSCKVCDKDMMVEWFGDEQTLVKVLETIRCNNCEE